MAFAASVCPAQICTLYILQFPEQSHAPPFPFRDFFQYTTGQISWQSCLPLSAANKNCPAGRSDILLSGTGLTGRLRICFLSVIFRNIHTKVFL